MKPELLPKKILMTADTVGGVWTYALELAKALEKFGIEILLATMGAKVSKHQYHEASQIGNLQLFESSYRLEWMQDPWHDVAAAGDWLLDLEERFGPDLIHLNGYAHGALPWRAPKIVVGHSCVLSWWRAVRGEDAPAEWRAYKDAVRKGLHSADLVVAPSRDMLSLVQRHYGPLSKTLVIPNGRSMLGSGGHQKQNFILAAGRLWDEAKNISALAELAPQLPWPVCIAGETNNPGATTNHEARVFAQNLLRPKPLGQGGVSPIYLGLLSSRELCGWFERASIYALPARYEPFGLTALEAALNGCALVLGDIPSLREIWRSAALYVDPCDTSAMRMALEQLIANPAWLESMAAEARSVARMYNPEIMAERYLAAYATLIQSKHYVDPNPTRKELLVCES